MKKHLIRLLVGATAVAFTLFVMTLLIRFPELLLSACVVGFSYLVGMFIMMEKTAGDTAGDDR